MEGFYLALAVGPLALYLVLIGTIRLRPHPFVTSGAKDSATLAIGLLGLVMIGPMELFFPQQAAVSLGIGVWGILLLFYMLCCALWILTTRRRLIIYGLSETRLRETLLEVAHTAGVAVNQYGMHDGSMGPGRAARPARGGGAQ